ncbi:MAG: hypothetical protein IJ038_01365, partial [Clostridia bacterium]|nr:hypothetical protein [Clostridia bacterium]
KNKLTLNTLTKIKADSDGDAVALRVRLRFACAPLRSDGVKNTIGLHLSVGAFCKKLLPLFCSIISIDFTVIFTFSSKKLQ